MDKLGRDRYLSDSRSIHNWCLLIRDEVLRKPCSVYPGSECCRSARASDQQQATRGRAGLRSGSLSPSLIMIKELIDLQRENVGYLAHILAPKILTASSWQGVIGSWVPIMGHGHQGVQ